MILRVGKRDNLLPTSKPLSYVRYRVRITFTSTVQARLFRTVSCTDNLNFHSQNSQPDPFVGCHVRVQVHCFTRPPRAEIPVIHSVAYVPFVPRSFSQTYGLNNVNTCRCAGKQRNDLGLSESPLQCMTNQGMKPSHLFITQIISSFRDI